MDTGVKGDTMVDPWRVAPRRTELSSGPGNLKDAYFPGLQKTLREKTNARPQQNTTPEKNTAGFAGFLL